MCVPIDGVCVFYVCQCMCGACVRGKGGSGKKYDVSLLMYYDNFVECFLFFSFTLIKGQFWMCCLKEMNFLFSKGSFKRS